MFRDHSWEKGLFRAFVVVAVVAAVSLEAAILGR